MPTKTRRTREGLKLSADTIKGLDRIAAAVGLPAGDVLRLLAQEPDRAAALTLEIAAREIAERRRAVGDRLDAPPPAGTVDRAGVPPGGVPSGPAEGRAAEGAAAGRPAARQTGPDRGAAAGRERPAGGQPAGGSGAPAAGQDRPEARTTVPS